MLSSLSQLSWCYNNLGNAFKEQGDITAAIDSITVLKLKLIFQMHISTGVMLQGGWWFDCGNIFLQNALKFRPIFRGPYNLDMSSRSMVICTQRLPAKMLFNSIQAPQTLITTLVYFQDYGDLEEALTNYRKSLDIDPTFSKALYGIDHSQLKETLKLVSLIL